MLFAALGAVLLALPVLAPGQMQCQPIPVEPPRDTHCDDGTEPLCDMIPPVCGEHEILAHQDDCYRCVNPDTCVPWGEPECRHDAECAPDEYCDPCGTGSCPFCEDCVAACEPHGCPTEEITDCAMPRPDCEGGDVAVIRNGCWECVDRETCEPAGGRDERCDDGGPLFCDMVQPECALGEVAAIQDGCWVCVNAITCRPWGEPGCQRDADCPVDEWCNFCATGSCPACLDCVAGCVVHGCPTEPEPACNMIRPDCEQGGVAVVRGGCWVCVGLNACAPIEPQHDPRCDDGTEPLCEMIPPVCGDYEILAYQNDCYVCVNALTCHPWGEPGCRSDDECEPWERCDACGTSSCPFCDDCVPACLPMPD